MSVNADPLQRRCASLRGRVPLTLDRMKHASFATLQQLEPLLVCIRGLNGLVERKPGTFYRRSSAFLAFS